LAKKTIYNINNHQEKNLLHNKNCVLTEITKKEEYCHKEQFLYSHSSPGETPMLIAYSDSPLPS